MTTWSESSLDSYEAAIELLQNQRFRSSISRAYYAAYAAVTDELIKSKKSFSYGRRNPGHEQMLSLVLNSLDQRRFGVELRRSLRRILKDMQRLRVVADYVPAQALAEQEAREQLRYAGFILRTLGVRP